MIGRAVQLSPEAGALLRVSAHGPFAVGAVVFRDARGRLVCTLVAKATYELVPGESAPLDEPHPICEEDGHWDDDPSKSVRLPSDLAPFKHAAEVVVVGSAFASAAVPSLVARVLVGPVDKALEVFPPRQLRQDGTLSPAAPLARFPLRYELAAGGGPGTDNPTGIDVSRADGLGRRSVPQILPTFFTFTSARDHVPTVGFGPIPPTWPSRSIALGPADRAWLRHPSRVSLPTSFPGRFFQVAPSDQWLDRPLAANERIVLEGLHPEIGRLVMSLSGLEPRAIVEGHAGEEPIRLTGDLLHVDTDQGICTLTYRTQIPLEEGTGTRKVVVIGVPVGREIPADEVHRLLESVGEDIETTHVESIVLGPPPAGATGRIPLWVERPVLPFAYEPSTRQPQPSGPDGALPFRVPDAQHASPPPPVPVTKAKPPPRPFPPPPRVPLPSTPLAVPTPPPSSPSIAMGAMASAPPVPMVSAPVPPMPMVSAVAPPAPVVSAPMPPAPVMSAPLPPVPMGGMAFPPASSAAAAPAAPPARRASLPSTSFDAAFGGVRAASDAAATASPAAASGSRREASAPAFPADDPSRAQPGDAAGRRQAVVSLVHFDAGIVPRVRRTRRFAAALAPKARPQRAQGVDEPQKTAPPDDRSDILRVLSCGRPADAAEIHRLLADSLDDPDDLDPPLVLVAGELRPIFDEVEVLRTTMAVAQQVAGGDKKILAAIAVGQEVLSAPVAPRPETTLGLVRQIEQAAGSLSLPARYVAAEVERVLVEGRKYKRRSLLGAARIRADLTLARSAEVMPLYVLDSAASSLPLLVSFPVVALCEVTPREDLTEASDEALFAQALGRVLRSR